MAGFFDSFLNRLVPGDQFSRDDKKGLLSRGLLEAGLTTLATPTGTGSGLMGVSRGLLGGLGGVREGAQDMEQGRMRQAMFGQQKAKADAEQAQLAQAARVNELRRGAYNPDGTINPQGMMAFRTEFPMEAIEFDKAANPQAELPSDVRMALYAKENPDIIPILSAINGAKAPPNLQYQAGLGMAYDPRGNNFVPVNGGMPSMGTPTMPQPARSVEIASPPGGSADAGMTDAYSLLPESEKAKAAALIDAGQLFQIQGGRVVPSGGAPQAGWTDEPSQPAMNPVVMSPEAPLEITGPDRAFWRTATPEKRQEYLDRKAGAAPAISSARPTEDMSKAAGWLSQAQLAVQNMKAAIGADPEANQATITERIAGVVPFAGDILERGVQSAPRQQYVNAASSLSEAVLRAATGAGVNADEAAQKVRELTPQIGDKPETIQQKMVMAENYLRALEARAGNAALPAPGAAGAGWKIEVVK